MRTRSPHPARMIQRCGIVLTVITLFGASAFSGSSQAADGDEALFLKENQTAMTRMMEGMSPKPTGDVDRDFVDMMVPHHQGAIDMAQAELRYGHNEKLRRMAQEIIVAQQQEIVAMRAAVGEPMPTPAPAPDQQKPAHPTSNDTHMNMPMPTDKDPQ